MQSADHSLKFFFSCSARQSLRGRKKTHTGRVALHPVKYRLILYSILRVYFTAYSGYTLQHTQMETHNYSTATSPPRSVPIISRHTRQMKSQNTRHHIILYSRALPSFDSRVRYSCVRRMWLLSAQYPVTHGTPFWSGSVRLHAAVADCVIRSSNFIFC